ncbi:MAG: anhydro-N-acetylmuramic acid kinase [Sedimentisphaerales bacterium]|jgi:anhydro-N-acetylmuramic acid kinase
MKTKSRIAELSQKSRMRVAGLMSGTSVDGVDAAIIDIDNEKVSVQAFDTFPYLAELRRSILQLCGAKSCNVADVCHLNFVLGEVFAESVLKLCKKSGIGLDTIDLIGSHGQTIYHNPKGRRFGRKTIRSTLQIGEPSIIAQRTGITTAADFRPRDMAAGGQGAPLVPFADYFLFRDKHRNRAIQNIGGIANVTSLPAGCRTGDIVAFDTGPGNMIIDGIISIISRGKQKFDRGGKIAARGTIDKTILDCLLKHPFLGLRPPKSTGREEFGNRYCDALYRKMKKKSIPAEDIIATVTAFTAESIVQAYRNFLPRMPDEVILCGGGAHNSTLVKMLRQGLGKSRILTSDDFGISCDAKEAISFAILAYAAIKGEPNNVPGATGATQPLVLGKIIPA